MSSQSELGGRRLPFYTCGALIVLLLLAMMLLPWMGPSWQSQRKRQREVVRERIESLGGWEVLRHQCVALVAAGYTNRFWPHQELGWLSNAAPAIALLQPQFVRVIAEPGQPVSVQIKLYGMKSSGGRGTPPYWLWVLCEETPGYTPEPQKGTVRKLADWVFEYY